MKVTISPQEIILPRFVPAAPANVSLDELSEKLSDVSFEHLAELRNFREVILAPRTLDSSLIEEEDKPTTSSTFNPRNSFRILQEQIDKELEKESDEDLKYHFQKSMNDLDNIQKSLRAKLYGEEKGEEKLVDSSIQSDDFFNSQTEVAHEHSDPPKTEVVQEANLQEKEPLVHEIQSVEQNEAARLDLKEDTTIYDVSSLDTEDRVNLNMDNSKEELVATYNQLAERLKSPQSTGVFVTSPKEDSFETSTNESIRKYEAEWKASLRARTNVEFTEKEMQRIRKIMSDKV